jgi:hypothetical protein
MNLQSVANDLRKTVDAAKGRLAVVDAKTVTYRPAADRWTIAEVIGHLIDSATNNHHRFVRAQFVEELVFPKYEQNEWVAAEYFNECDWPSLVELWHRYNHHLAHVIEHVKTESLDRRCLIGPYPPVTLGFLIEDYVGHLKHHLAKIDQRLGT